MQLKDFVSSALQEIMEGVVDAQASTKKIGAVIVPELGPQAPGTLLKQGVHISNTLQVIEFVEFNVAVSTSETSEVSGNAKSAIKILVGSFGGSVGAKTAGNTESQHRIKFRVPVAYPKNGS